MTPPERSQSGPARQERQVGTRPGVDAWYLARDVPPFGAREWRRMPRAARARCKKRGARPRRIYIACSHYTGTGVNVSRADAGREWATIAADDRLQHGRAGRRALAHAAPPPAQ